MNNSPNTGRVHSIQTLGTLDGPGVRFVVFLQGCPLRCGCCHNPDTWNMTGGNEIAPNDLLDRALRYRAYFGTNGGVTLSGGEPLMQAGFATEFFRECKKNGLHTCLDTSGVLFDTSVATLLEQTDHVLLDIKYPTDELYRTHVGCSIQAPLHFLKELHLRNIPVTLRQVIIPTLNDTRESMVHLASLKKTYGNVEKIELLPFKKICTIKYENMGIPFPFAPLPTPSHKEMEAMEELLSKALAITN